MKKTKVLTKIIALFMSLLIICSIPVTAMAASGTTETYTVIFIADGGVLEQYEVAPGKSVVCPDPIAVNNLRFDCWEDQDTGETYASGTILTPRRDMTLTAHYKLDGGALTLNQVIALIVQLIINAIAVMLNNPSRG